MDKPYPQIRALRRGGHPFTPAGSWNFFIYLNSRGYYVMPLMICIPFLLFPAWLSIRIAMRPEQGGR